MTVDSTSGPQQPGSTARTALVAMAVAAAVSYNSWILGPLVPELPLTTSLASEYGSPVWRLSWVFRLGDLFTAMLLVGVVVLGTRMHLACTRATSRPLAVARIIFVALSAVFAVATLFDASFPMPCPYMTTSAAALDSPECLTVAHYVHEFTSGTVGTVAVAAMAVVAVMQFVLVGKATGTAQAVPDKSLLPAGSRLHGTGTEPAAGGFPGRMYRVPMLIVAVFFALACLYCTGSFFFGGWPLVGIVQRLSLVANSLWWVLAVTGWLASGAAAIPDDPPAAHQG
ncbi:DUF998 domain-containing protein [Corynebacterium mendelii]|uniref:DUF998 domain-containing protein n=1 Tax=Corynebacterium mendelii TaxID=2765362 RepID=A0A939IYY6_9CORY|nr:DUF998 domain-containing protein [Corynebacterium mendelii]MBN9645157.1 DUF998 domain-containing protein [Corynebacterium mendelii]